MTQKNEQIIREKDLVTRRIAGETIVVPVRSGVGDLTSIFTLNETGSFVWELIEKGVRFGQIAEALSGEYEVPMKDAEMDLATFLESLREAGLIQFLGESPD
jgi:hypothetical protein